MFFYQVTNVTRYCDCKCVCNVDEVLVNAAAAQLQAHEFGDCRTIGAPFEAHAGFARGACALAVVACLAAGHAVVKAALEAGADRADIPGFVLTGYGLGAFSAGADIGRFPDMLGDREASVQYARDCARVQRYMDRMDKPVVAAVERELKIENC